MRTRIGKRARATLSWCFLAPLLACTRDPAGSAGTAVAAREPATPVVERAARSLAEPVVALRRALEFGDLGRARELLPSAGEAGPEAVLLRARLAILEGRSVEAMRELEAAKAARPRDPDVWATAAEVYAARDAFDTAWIELRRGEEACGETAEILRAKGVCWISRENGAERGLELLTRARALDPKLPFCERALGQAHLLVGKLRARNEKPAEALASARASLAHDPDDVDARRFLADCLAGTGDHDGAAAEIRALIEAGEPLAGELASLEKRAGFARLLAGDKPGAIAHFLAARAGGLSEGELASAADILAEGARERTDAGLAAYARAELEAAEVEFRAALELDPASLAARNHLAVVRFQRGDPGEAARLWRGVLDEARAARIELPEPVHVNLAQAELQRGERGAARAVLEGYLRDEPRGEWVGATRALLAQIEAGDGPR